MRILAISLVCCSTTLAADPAIVAKIRALETQLQVQRDKARAIPDVEKPVWMSPLSLTKGEVGRLSTTNDDHSDYPGNEYGYRYRVERVLNKNSMIVRARRIEPIASMSLLLKVPTEKYADESKYVPDGFFRVLGTEKLGGSTYFVLEPVEKPKVEKDPKEAIKEVIARLDAELKKALQTRDGEVFAVAKLFTANAKDTALKEVPIVVGASVQERIKATAQREKLETTTLSKLREELAKKYDISPEEVQAIEQTGKRLGWTTEPARPAKK